jgi:hypothetical protein
VHLFEIDGKGKGSAIRSSWGSHLADADALAFTDADLAADISALPALVVPILSGKADLACGSRYVAGSRTKRGFVRTLVSKLYRILQRAILKLPVQDAQCGFKAISKDAAAELLPLCREDAWLFDTELIAFAMKKGKRIVEVPVDWIEHRNPQRRSALRVFRDGWGFLAGLWRIRRRIKTSAS